MAKFWIKALMVMVGVGAILLIPTSWAHHKLLAVFERLAERLEAEGDK